MCSDERGRINQRGCTEMAVSFWFGGSCIKGEEAVLVRRKWAAQSLGTSGAHSKCAM